MSTLDKNTFARRAYGSLTRLSKHDTRSTSAQIIDGYLSQIPDDEKLRYLQALIEYALSHPDYEKQELLLEYLSKFEKSERDALMRHILENKNTGGHAAILEFLGHNRMGAFEMPRPNTGKLLKNASKLRILINAPRTKVQTSLSTAPFVMGVINALSEGDTEQLDYIFSNIPLEKIEEYIKPLVYHAILNNRNEKELAIYLSQFLDRVSSTPQKGLTNEQMNTLRNLSLNLKANDPTSIVNPNLQRLARHVSAKNAQTRRIQKAWQNEQTYRARQRNAYYRQVNKTRAPYNVSGWNASKRKTRRRRN